MAWIKFWASRWLLSAGRLEMTDTEKAVWFDLLAFAGESTKPGEIWYDNIENFSIRMMRKSDIIKGVLCGFNNSGKIVWAEEDNRIIIKNWDEFQSGKMVHCVDTIELMKNYHQDDGTTKCAKSGITHRIDKRRRDKRREETDTSSCPDAVERLFVFYEENMQTKIKRTPGRKQKFNLRKKLFTLDDLKRAVTNVSRSPFHMGQNDKGVKFNSIDLIIRSDENVEKYMNMAGKGKDDWMNKVKEGA